MPNDMRHMLKVLLLAGVVSFEVRAAVEDFTELPIEKLLDIEVQSASKFRQQAIDAPAAVSVVTAEDIRTYGYRTLGEIIGAMRGVYLTYDRYFTYVGVRGFARAGDYNTRILLLIDGIRQNDAVYHQTMVGTESPLDVDLIDRVEFVPGAGSSIYGSNAFFGVLNVITKNGGDYRGGETGVAVGSYRTAKGRFTYGDVGDDGMEWLVSGSSYYQRGQDLDFPKLGGRAHDLDSDRNNSLFAKLRTETLSLSAMLASRTKENPTASFGQIFDAPGSKSTDESASFGMEYRRALGPELNLTARAYLQQYRYEGDFVYSLPPNYINRDRSGGTMWGGEAQFTATHFRNQRIVFGVEYRRDADVRQRNFDVRPYTSYLDDRANRATAGVYVQDEMTLGEHWLLNAGVRHDRPGGGVEGATSPRLGLIYKPMPKTALKLLYGKAYRSPNAFELYYQTDIPAGYRSNPNLKAETIRSRELVIEHALSPSQRLVASLYRNDVHNLIRQQYDVATDRLYFDNLSSAIARGMELEWTGRLSGGVEGRVSFSWQRGEDGSSGARLENSPTRMFKANVSAPFWEERLRAGLEVQAMSDRRTWLGSTPGFALANLTLWVPHLMRNLDMSVSAYNLFDRKYSDPAGSDLNPLDRVEQNGRNLRVKLVHRF